MSVMTMRARSPLFHICRGALAVGAMLMLLMAGCGEEDTYGHLGARCEIADNDIDVIRWGLFDTTALGGELELLIDDTSGGIRFRGDTGFAPDPFRLPALTGGIMQSGRRELLVALDDAPRTYLPLCFADTDGDEKLTLSRASPSEQARLFTIGIDNQMFRLARVRYVPDLDLTEAHVTASEENGGLRRVTRDQRDSFRAELSAATEERAVLGAAPAP